MAKKKKTKSMVQALIFGSGWKPKDARKWMKDNGFKPKGRVHKTKPGKSPGSLKYTIEDADKFQFLSFKKTSKGLSLILGITDR